MNLTIKIMIGTDAWKLINDSDFIALWENLSQNSYHVTVIQKPGFAITWYKCYTNTYQPVLCIGYDDKNEIAGIMPLALSLRTNSITHAGADHAEYNGWVCRPEAMQHFPAACIIEIKKSFNLKKWEWRWMPPRSDNSAFLSPALPKENIYIKYQKTISQILDLSDQEKMKNLIGNKSTKTKINRYKKKGNFRLERVKDKDRASTLLEILRIQCDFRQLAVHKVAPFEIDRNKMQFYTERMNFPDNNHFTVLWLDESPLAFHIGSCDHDTVYLGLTSFDPVESKNSAGSLLFIELAFLMAKEGFRYFDLTPGKDEHKKRLGNKSQELVRPTFYFNPVEKIKADANELSVNIIKKGLSLIGLQPVFIRTKIGDIKQWSRRFKCLTPEEKIKHLFSVIYEQRRYVLYKILAEDAELNHVDRDTINVQKYSDLLLYTGSNPMLTRSEILFTAMKRFAAGDTLYSVVKGDVLVHYGWMSNSQKTDSVTETDFQYDAQPSSVRLYDFYTEPDFRRQGIFSKTITRMLHDSFSLNATEVYIGADFKNLIIRKAIEKIGFRHFRTFRKTKTLWFTKNHK